MRIWICIIVSIVLFTGCEETNLDLATEAGMDAVRAITLTDDQVRLVARNAAALSDEKNRVAGPGSSYDRRLKRLIQGIRTPEAMPFNIRIYLDPRINAFAMADGSVRLYSGLMDRMDDGELLFVIGHELGHVAENHVKRKMMVALASSALRKGIASQENMAGYIAASALGGLVQELANAQFSQQEEQAADDFGLAFLTSNGFAQPRAVETAARALEKLARTSPGHSFLSSHPRPEKRAARIRSGEPRALPGLVEKMMDTGRRWVESLKNLITG